MAKVSLRNIWDSSLDDLRPILATQNLEEINDLQTARIAVAYIARNEGELEPSEIPLVDDPIFETQGYVEYEPLSPDIPSPILKESINEGLVSHFMKLARYYRIEGEKYRANAFETVANIIRELETPITSLQDVRGISGIGASSRTEIGEYLIKGTSTRVQELSAKHSDADTIISKFRDVFGIGDVKAFELYQSGARTIEDLKKMPLTHAQRLGVDYYDDFRQRIPRSEMNQFNEYLHTILKDFDFEIVGSYRRGEPTSGDIDVIIRDDDPQSTVINQIVKILTDGGFLVGTLAQGPRKFMGACRLQNVGGDAIVHRIDFRLFTSAEWPYAMLYNTGSRQFNILLRHHANTLGYTLNEYQLRSLRGQAVPTLNSERDVFDFLGLQYLEPIQRTQGISELPKKSR